MNLVAVDGNLATVYYSTSDDAGVGTQLSRRNLLVGN